VKTTETRTVQVTVTIHRCDFCEFRVEDQSWMCGCAPVMACTVCKKHVCREHRTFYEDGPSDYPDAIVCPECKTAFQAAWDKADEVAGRHDSRLDVAMGLL